MIFRRTSIKTFVASLPFVLAYFFAGRLAERYYQSTNPIDFGVDFRRPWNPWDYVALGSLILAAALVVVSLMFLRKDD